MVDQMLGGLFGAQDTDDEPTRRRRAHDFIDRHERGMHDQMSNDEVLQNYRATTAQLSPDEYRQTARDAMRQMSPEQRKALRREMRQRSGGRYEPASESPEDMAQTMQQAHQDNQSHGGLGSLFGFGGSDASQPKSEESSPVDKVKGVLYNPIAKVALAGMAAVAAKKLNDRGL
jgi:hypothetical protein